jgi:hypothetical protein
MGLQPSARMGAPLVFSWGLTGWGAWTGWGLGSGF